MIGAVRGCILLMAVETYESQTEAEAPDLKALGASKRPMELAQLLRQGLHLACGAGAVCLKFWPVWAVSSVLLFGMALSVGVFHLRGRHGLLRPEEGYLSGALWYALGVLGAVLLLPSEAALVGWLVLAAGDSAATVVGSHMPLWRFAGRKRSLGGMLGFFGLSLGVLTLGLFWWHEGAVAAVPFARLLGVCAVCAAAETLVTRLNDNLYLPLLAGSLYVFYGLW